VGVIIFYLSNVILSATLQAAHNSIAVVILSGFMAVLLVPIYASLIVALDRHVTEPGWFLFGAFFWGAIVAAGIAFILNTKVLIFLAHLAGPRAAQLFTATLVAPVVEETGGIRAVDLYPS
jgi:RsiW-degrading membrane proteinase PrsW (M82 family)